MASSWRTFVCWLAIQSNGNLTHFSSTASRPAKKVFIIGVALQFLEQFSGVFGLLFFVSTIFQYSGSSVSPNMSSIIVGVIQLIGAYCSTMFVDKAGRRFLISTSAFGISLGMFVFAAFSFLNDRGHVASYLNWIPLVSFSFVLWIANLGVLTLPFLVTSELMITQPKVSINVLLKVLEHTLSVYDNRKIEQRNSIRIMFTHPLWMSTSMSLVRVSSIS